MRLDHWSRIHDGAPCRLDPGARRRVAAGARTVAAILRRGLPVYGINTGFGRLADRRIESGDLGALQRNLVLSHAAGVGRALPAKVVRLMMALKLAALARGASGVRWGTVAHLATMLARGMIPVIPGQGSVGASGDLAPLAHLAAAMIGVGTAELEGEVLPAEVALARIGLAPIVLGPKEGLALLNGTQASTALALASLFAIEQLFAAAILCGALSVDAALASDAPFDPRIGALRPHPGQIDVAAALVALLAGSRIRASHQDCGKVQDPYSVRCQPQVMGACLDLMRFAAATLEREAASVTDNPVVFPDTGEVLSGGNFHAEPVAFAADIMALAVAEIGALAERRIAMLTDGTISGLPMFLAAEPGLDSGFMIAHVTAAALASENKQRAAPASVDSLPTSANQEDHVSMATHAARRLMPMIENTTHIVAIELLVASSGIDHHAPLRSSPTLERVRARLRRDVKPMTGDRYLAPDIAAAAALIRDGALIALAREKLRVLRFRGQYT